MIRVGAEFQAAVPEGLLKYDHDSVYMNDISIWDPSKLPEEETEAYLQEYAAIAAKKLQACKIPDSQTGDHVRDHEKALFLLSVCDYNKTEAINRFYNQTFAPIDIYQLWSTEDCNKFDAAVKKYRKNFHQIQKNRFPEKSTKELVEFYYTEKSKKKVAISKPESTLCPGTTCGKDESYIKQEPLNGIKESFLRDDQQVNLPPVIKEEVSVSVKLEPEDAIAEVEPVFNCAKKVQQAFVVKKDIKKEAVVPVRRSERIRSAQMKKLEDERVRHSKC